MEDIQKAELQARQEEQNKIGNGVPVSADSSLHHAQSDHGSPVLLIACFLGIFVSYFIYGLLQEKITKVNFDGERFRYFMFLVGIQCVINAVFAKSASIIQRSPVSLKPFRPFSALAFTYVGAMVSSNTALSYISYPTQVIGKSAKPIPVLFFGVLIGHRKYPLVKYLIVLLIVAGVILFNYKDGSGRGTGDQQWKLLDLIGAGEFLVLLSLTFDGLTGVIQDSLKLKHDVRALHMMYAVNVISAVYLAVGMFLSGEGLEAAGFVQRHPYVMLNIVAFSLASAIGQIFIFTTITNFGPLTCSIFTTTRKFFTFLGSVIIFNNTLLSRQWVGVVLVFIGLGLDIAFGKPTKRHHHHHRHGNQTDSAPSGVTSSV